jgi:DNA-directed RNA polymerase subunit alpha
MDLELREKNWKSLIRPKRLVAEEETLTDTYGRFFAEPLERGFGMTLGNALRRILLSSIQGAAVTAVRIDGSLHEFSVLPGIKEDVTEIILNVKELVFRLHTPIPKSVAIDAVGKKVVTARDIETDSEVEIINPDLHIATLDKDTSLKMELTVKMGKGYVTSERNKEEEMPIGTIPVDSIFSPVKKVNYTVTNARVGQITDYDRLILEVWTDGSIKPDDAVALAAKIMKDQLTIFINFDEPPEETVTDEDDNERRKRETQALREKLMKSVDELELSVRSHNCLKNANISYIWELVRKSEQEILQTKNFGRKSLNEIKDVLSAMDLELGMDVEGLIPLEEDEEEE